MAGPRHVEEEEKEYAANSAVVRDDYQKYLQQLERVLEEDEKMKDITQASDGDFSSFRDPDANFQDQSLGSHNLREQNDPDFIQELVEVPGYREWKQKPEEFVPVQTCRSSSVSDEARSEIVATQT